MLGYGATPTCMAQSQSSIQLVHASKEVERLGGTQATVPYCPLPSHVPVYQSIIIHPPG